VKVIDAATNDERALAQSPPLPLGTSGWQKFTVEFGTASNTRAVIIAVERQQCESEQCPIFGKVWFDDFSLQDHRRL